MHVNLFAKLSSETLIQQFYLCSSHRDAVAWEAEHTSGTGLCWCCSAKALLHANAGAELPPMLS